MADTTLKPEDEWITKVDIDAFKQEVQQMGQKLLEGQGEADMVHLHRMIMWSDICCAVGLMTMWMAPNPFTVMALSLWTMSRWTMIAHHTCHGGYDKCDTTKKHNRFTFAVGSLFQRTIHWMDWMLPEAWNVEHNVEHHYKLGEDQDPDLVQRNLRDLRAMQIPLIAKYAIVAFFAFTWKWMYYAPNTFKHLQVSEIRRSGKPVPPAEETDPPIVLMYLHVAPAFLNKTRMLLFGMAPYFILHFVALPLPFYLLGYNTLCWNAVTNLVLGELLTNAHSFVIVATNHAGDDLYRFEDSCAPRSGTFYMRQVVSSVNFSCGNDFVDFMHGWLNYQIEHHMWPQLSMLSYQRSQPMVQALCKKHNIPYIKENVFWRVKKTVDIMVGTASMRNFPQGILPSTK